MQLRLQVSGGESRYAQVLQDGQVHTLPTVSHYASVDHRLDLDLRQLSGHSTSL